MIVSDGATGPTNRHGSTPSLDLEGCTLSQDRGLLRCRFAHAPVLRDAWLPTRVFHGSHFPGVTTNRLEARAKWSFGW